jgi:SAM-dependent methyltransferase
MSVSVIVSSAKSVAGDFSCELFERQWKVYRKVVDCNLMQHREIYGLLHRLLVEEMPGSFTFLDVACGDAGASVEALLGTRIAAYHGIHLSGPALDLARGQVTRLPCIATLEQRDFADALRHRSEPADVVWLGQSLHHLDSTGKGAVLRDLRRLLADDGLFLLWEPTRFDGESREAWLERFEDRWRPYFSILTAEEWSAMAGHVRAADFPETVSAWLDLGQEAGFSQVSELMQAPFDLARLYCLCA